MVLNAPFPDLRGEHRAEPVPPEPYRLVADIDTALEQQVLDPAQRQRVPDIHHNCGADYLRRTIAIAEGVFIRRSYGTHLTGSSRFTLTTPMGALQFDVCGRDGVLLVVERWYDFPEPGAYMGNVG